MWGEHRILKIRPCECKLVTRSNLSFIFRIVLVRSTSLRTVSLGIDACDPICKLNYHQPPSACSPPSVRRCRRLSLFLHTPLFVTGLPSCLYLMLSPSMLALSYAIWAFVVLGSSTTQAFSFTNSAPTECDDLSVSWNGRSTRHAAFPI